MDYTLLNLNRWTMPEHYAGAGWPEYFVSLARHRDSDNWAQSNFHTALEELGGETDTVLVVREGHRAFGWIEWIAIHETDHNALVIASDIADRLEDYPVLNEDDWAQREHEAAQEVWANCYDNQDRLAFMRKYRNEMSFHDFADMLRQARGEYFSGYGPELLS